MIMNLTANPTPLASCYHGNNCSWPPTIHHTHAGFRGLWLITMQFLVSSRHSQTNDYVAIGVSKPPGHLSGCYVGDVLIQYT
jgi:hypothetical protein